MSALSLFIYERLDAERKRAPLSKERWLAVVDIAIAEHKMMNKRRPRAKPTDRPQNELFNALALATGCQDVGQLTRDGARVVGVALADIREACPAVTVTDINRVTDAYRRRHPTWTCTAKAIAKHWSEFATGPQKTKLDIYVEPTGWRTSEAARMAMKASVETWAIVIDRDWFDLATDIRKDIVRAL